MGLKVGEFELVNDEKINRALNGSVTKNGVPQGGLLRKHGTNNPDDVPPTELLAEYDRLGGLILKDGNKLKIGCFYNFTLKQPLDKPVVIFVERIDGEEVELDESEARAIQKAKKKVKEIKGKKLKRK